MSVSAKPWYLPERSDRPTSIISRPATMPEPGQGTLSTSPEDLGWQPRLRRRWTTGANPHWQRIVVMIRAHRSPFEPGHQLLGGTCEWFTSRFADGQRR